jgi:hypothetical protein
MRCRRRRDGGTDDAYPQTPTLAQQFPDVQSASAEHTHPGAPGVAAQSSAAHVGQQLPVPAVVPSGQVPFLM